MRKRARKILAGLVGAAILAAGAVLGTSIATAGDTTQTATTTRTETTAATLPVDDANLELVARSAAARFGEKRPTDLVVVTGGTNKAAITTLTGAVVENAGEGAVDVVQEQGNFTTPTAPFGQTPPTGHSLTIVISRDTREATDIYMAEGDASGPSLANLGRGNPTALQ